MPFRPWPFILKRLYQSLNPRDWHDNYTPLEDDAPAELGDQATNFTATADGTTINLSWENPDSDAHLYLFRATSESGPWSLIANPPISTGTTSYEDSGLDSETAYYYKLLTLSPTLAEVPGCNATTGDHIIQLSAAFTNSDDSLLANTEIEVGQFENINFSLNDGYIRDNRLNSTGVQYWSADQSDFRITLDWYPTADQSMVIIFREEDRDLSDALRKYWIATLDIGGDGIKLGYRNTTGDENTMLETADAFTLGVSSMERHDVTITCDGADITLTIDGPSMSESATLTATDTFATENVECQISSGQMLVIDNLQCGTPGIEPTVQGENGPIVPDQPTGFTATANGSDQIDLTWTNNDIYDRLYLYWSSQSESGEFTGIEIVDPTDTSYSHTGLDGSTQYWYRLVAGNIDAPFLGPDATDTTDSGAVTYVGAGTLHQSTAGGTIALPAGIQEGDLMFAHIAWFQSNVNAGGMTGWTRIHNPAAMLVSAYHEVFMKVAGASESDPTFSVGGSPRHSVASIVAFRGASETLEDEVSASHFGTTYTMSNLTSGGDGRAFLGFWTNRRETLRWGSATFGGITGHTNAVQGWNGDIPEEEYINIATSYALDLGSGNHAGTCTWPALANNGQYYGVLLQPG